MTRRRGLPRLFLPHRYNLLYNLGMSPDEKVYPVYIP